MVNEISDNPDYAREKALQQAKLQEQARIEAAQELLRRKRARNSLYEFMKFVWWKNDPFIEGQHLKDICKELDIAIDKLLDPNCNESSYLDIAVCYGHSKSTICSIALPAYLLGRSFGIIDTGILMTGYGASLIEGFSKDVKKVICSEAYTKLFPLIEIPHGSNSAKEWGIKGSSGKVSAASLGGQITGKRVHLLIVDDYFKSLVEARSRSNRDKLWDGFKSDVMSRLMPKAIVLIVATPWHTAGIQGKIRVVEASDPDFPRFKHIKFSARKVEDDKTYYLWPEMYPESWYREAYSLNKGSMAAALLDCDPISTEGNRFELDKICEHNLSEFPEGRYIRAWDLASSTKQRSGDNPDFTVGVLAYIQKVNNRRRMKEYNNLTKLGIYEEVHFWIRDIILLREEAPRRNERIIQTAVLDTTRTPILVEDYGAYKDSFTELRSILNGYNIKGQHLHKEKSAKAAGLEPIFMNGWVHIPKNVTWRDEFIRQFSSFPDGDHDDIVDACSIIYNDSMEQQSSILVLK